MQQIFLNTEYFMSILQKSIDTVNNGGDVKELKNFIYNNMKNTECVDFPSPKNITRPRSFTFSQIGVIYYSGPKLFNNNTQDLESINIDMIKIDSKGRHKFTLYINIYRNGNIAISIIPGDLYSGDNIVIGLDAVKFLRMLDDAVDIISCKEFDIIKRKVFENSIGSLVTRKRPSAYINNKQCTTSLKYGKNL